MRLINPLDRIGGRIFIVFTLLVVSLTLSLGFMGLKFAQETISANAANELRVMSVTLARMVQFRLARLEANLAGLDKDGTLLRELRKRRPDSWIVEEFLRAQLIMLPIYQDLAVYNRDGNCVASTSMSLCSLTGKRQTFFEQGLKGPGFSDVITKDEGKIQLVSTPLGHDGIVRGVLVGEINLASIYDMMDQKLGLSETTDAFLVDAALRFITPGKMELDRLLQSHLVSTQLSKHLKDEFWVDRYKNFDGDEVLGTVMKIPGRALYIVVERHIEEVTRPLRAAKQAVTLATLALVCALIVTTFFLTRSITRPLMELVAGTQRIAEGDFQKELQAPRGSDEVRFLAAEINKMRARIAAFQESMIVRLEESERKRIENERLAAIGTLASTMAHEIRNPLNAMSLLLARLELARGATHIVENTVKGLHGEIARLDRLVSDILDYAKPLQLSITAIDLTDLLQNTLSIYRGAFDAKKIQCHVHFTGPSHLIQGDADKLKQCLVNVIQNAIDASQEGDQLEIRSQLIDSTIELSVLDEGVGLKEGSEKRLFDLFYTTKARGTGLGLATVKKILDAHGARVSIESRQLAERPQHRAARGTVVCMSFPALLRRDG